MEASWSLKQYPSCAVEGVCVLTAALMVFELGGMATPNESSGIGSTVGGNSFRCI